MLTWHHIILIMTEKILVSQPDKWRNSALYIVVLRMIPSSFRLANWSSTGESVKHQVYAKILLNVIKREKIIVYWSLTALFIIANLSWAMLHTWAKFLVFDDHKWMTTWWSPQCMIRMYSTIGSSSTKMNITSIFWILLAKKFLNKRTEAINFIWNPIDLKSHWYKCLIHSISRYVHLK